MTKLNVIEMPTQEQEPYCPTQLEIRAALVDEISRDFSGGDTPIVPVRIYAIIRRAFDRANAGEFKV